MLAREDIDRVRQPLARSWTLPPGAYADPAIFRAELEAIFARDWICVARADQLEAPGDYLCVNLVDQPIVLVRGRDAKLRALSRVCLHRAMPLVSGTGNANRFVCPYHSWTFELDGALRSAPMMGDLEDFDPASCRLPDLPLECWNGFVFVNRDSDAKPLAPQLERLAGLIAPYRCDDLQLIGSMTFDSPWNWKILVENFMEAYHHIGTHRQTLEPVYPARDSSVEDNHGAPWTLLRMPAGADARQAEPGGVYRDLPEAARHQLLAINVFPTLLFAVSDNGAFWYQLQPTAHDAMDLEIHYLVPSAIAAQLDDGARAHILEQVRAVHLEDIEVNAGPWQGLQAGLTRQGRLSTYEKAIWQLNQLWLDRMEPHLQRSNQQTEPRA